MLVRCPGCRNLHLVADHLGYFADEDGGSGDVDVESILRARGEAVRTGRMTAAAGADAFVTELTPSDAAVLASPTKSVSLATGAPVTEEYEHRPAAPAGAFSIGAPAVGEGAGGAGR